MGGAEPSMLLANRLDAAGNRICGFCWWDAATPWVAPDFGPAIRFPDWRRRRGARKVRYAARTARQGPRRATRRTF